MSYSLSINGHHNDAAIAADVDELVHSAGAELVEKLRDMGADPSYATFGGPTGSVNFLAPVEDSPGLRQLTGEDVVDAEPEAPPAG